MKKTTFVITLLFIIFSTAFAGSIDVELLADNEALVFIGCVDDYTVTYEEPNYPNTEYSVTITPHKKLKGDVTTYKSMYFENVETGKIKLKEGTSYLFGYLKNKLYLWELDEYNNLFDWEIGKYTKDSIILKERHNDSISGGMQKLLNDNSFVLAEQKRQSTNKQITSTDTTQKPLIFIYVILILFILLIILRRRKYNA